MKRIRIAAEFAVILGVGLLVASVPVEAVTGAIGAAALIIIGTIGCVESKA